MNWALLFFLFSIADRAVIESVFVRQAEIGRRLAGVNYRAEFKYIETDILKGTIKRLGCIRRVIMTGYDEQTEVFLSATVDGREVDGEKMRQVCQELKRKGLIARKSRMPFLVATRDEYEYEVYGVAEIQGESCRVIKFFPKRADNLHLRGKGYVSLKGYDVVRLEFVPARLPFVVREARMVLDYKPVQGFWLPSRFAMWMGLRVKVFKEFWHQRLEIEDVYDDYQLYLNRDGA
ncbi:MAG: hypothetical protein ABIK49_05700 [candidate division WOR-3 bacterium]